jgi:outer membrane protein
MVAAAVFSRAADAQTSEARIGELVRAGVARLNAAQAQEPARATALVTPLSMPPDSRPVVSLSLDEVVKLALDRNLTLAVQRLNPAAFDPAIESLRATYWPQLTSQLSSQSQVNPPTNSTNGIPAGATGVTQGTQFFNGGLSQNMPWGGGQLAVSLNNIRSTSTSTTVLYNPTFLPTYSAQYTQPLLRGFSIDPNRQQLLVTEIARQISDLQLRSTILNTLANVRESYWSYVYTVQAVEVAQQAIGLAAELVRDNQVRVDVGVMTQLDTLTAQSQLAQANVAFTQAIGNRDTAEVALKQLIVAGTQDSNWNARIDPVDRPEFRPDAVDLPAAIRRALTERTDLLQAKQNIQANDVTFRFLKNQLLPQADLVGRYGFAGLGGTQFVRETDAAINSQIINEIPGGFGNSLGSLFTNQYPTWSVQLNVSMPIGHQNVANASIAAAKIQLDQVSSQMRQIELQVASDVTNAAITVRNDSQAVEAAQIAERLAQEAYDAERTKLDVGLSTIFNVTQDLNALNAAKGNSLQATLNYQNARVELDRLQQTTQNPISVGSLGGPAWSNGSAAIGNLTGSPVGSAR